VQILELKLRLQSGKLNAEAWKKKILDEVPEGLRAMAVAEALRFKNFKLSNTLERAA
jgi:hypothetical protein